MVLEEHRVGRTRHKWILKASASLSLRVPHIGKAVISLWGPIVDPVLRLIA